MGHVDLLKTAEVVNMAHIKFTQESPQSLRDESKISLDSYNNALNKKASSKPPKKHFNHNQLNNNREQFSLHNISNSPISNDSINEESDLNY